MTERTCGGCTACCKTHMVLSIEKPPLTWCGSCVKGKGCGIYASRPEECAAFTCQWLMGFGADIERPDKVRIVVDFSRNPVLDNVLVAQLWEVSSDALKSDFATRTIQQLMGGKLPILTISCTANQSLFLPKGFPISQEAYDAYTKDGVQMKYYNAL